MKRQCLNTGSCPFCGSGRIKVTNTIKPRRRFQCKVCQKRWKCLEIIERDFWLSDVLTELLSEGRLAEYDFKTRKAITAICSANYKPGVPDMAFKPIAKPRPETVK
jgi:transcriptional regulator NrdR family protein